MLEVDVGLPLAIRAGAANLSRKWFRAYCLSPVPLQHPQVGTAGSGKQLAKTWATCSPEACFFVAILMPRQLRYMRAHILLPKAEVASMSNSFAERWAPEETLKPQLVHVHTVLRSTQQLLQ